MRLQIYVQIAKGAKVLRGLPLANQCHCGQNRPYLVNVQRNQKGKPFLMGTYVFLYP